MTATGSTSIEDLLQRNRDYAQSVHKAVPDLLTIFRGSFKLNAPHLLIISCLDSRANPNNFLQIKTAEAIVIRNVGGRVKNSLADILALDSQFGLDRILVVQHSNCGSGYIKTGQISEYVKATTEDAENAEAWETAIMRDVHTPSERIREDLALLRKQPYLRKELVDSAVGIWLDVKTGLVEVVDPQI